LEKIEMKKTLVAVAALAAFSAAQADVSITGIFEASIANTTSGTSLGAGTNGGSEITFSVAEDLGSGLKAFGSTTIVQTLGDSSAGYTGVQPTAGSSIATATATASPFGSYQNFIGVGGEFGSVKLGQFWSNTFLTSTVGDVMGRAALTNQLFGGAQGQIANAVNYTSPTFSGVTVNYQKALDTTVGTEQYSSYSVGYSNGGLNVSFASGIAGITTKTRENIYAANYNFGMATLFAGTRNTSITSAASTSGTSYGVAVPFGATTVSVAMGSASSSIKNYQAMVNYDLSKRTRVYIHTANGTTAANPVTTQVGIRHNF